MNFNLKIKDNPITLKVKPLNTILQKTIGLMFKNNSPILLFNFKRPTKTSIHSFFCNIFIAIWLLEGEIIDIKIVEPNQLSIKPREKFNQLIEIPNNSDYFQKITKILDDTRNI